MSKNLIIPDEVVMNKILLVRGQKVMIDRDLAELYGTTTVRLNEQVKRNKKRFPPDFMFQLTENEKNEVIANCDNLQSLKFSPHLPYAFTEHGAVMLASVLSSDKAIAVNIQIVRVFVKIRQILMDTTEFRLIIEQIKRKTENNTKNIEVVFRYLDEFIEKQEKSTKAPEKKKIPRKLIGYKVSKKS